VSRTARSGAVTFAVQFQPEPLGGCRGHYDVTVTHGLERVEVMVGAPTALLGEPESKASIAEVAETVAHFLLSDGPLPVERSEGRVIVRV